MSEVLCNQCPLRPLPLFLDNSADEIAMVQSLKRRETRLRADEVLIHEGQTDAALYTLLHGWAFRFKTLKDGRRQVTLSGCNKRWEGPPRTASSH